MSTNSLGCRATLRVGDNGFEIFSLRLLEKAGFTNVARLPYSIKILLENLLRHEDGRT